MKTVSNLIRLVICLLVVLNLFTQPSIAYACSCVADITIPENFAIHDAVFAGKVVRIVDNYSPFYSTADHILYRLDQPSYFFYKFVRNDEKRLGFSIFFKVTNSWKGIESTYVSVNTGRGGGDCGYSFSQNKEYLIYAGYGYGIPGNYWVTSICSGNSIFTHDLEDLKYLNTKPSLSLKYSIPVFWTENDSITLSLLTLFGVALVLLQKNIRNNKKKTSSDK